MNENNKKGNLNKFIIIAVLACGIAAVSLLFVALIYNYKEKLGPEGIYYATGDYFFQDDMGDPDEKLVNEYGDIIISRNNKDVPAGNEGLVNGSSD